MNLISGGYRDNVARREQFEAEHPDVVITSVNRGMAWYAKRDGEEIATAVDLGRLMDRLEKLTAGQPTQDADSAT
jgi:hypothetical protein